MLRRIHLIVGLLGITAFLLTGQLMKHHDPPTRGLATDVRMMYVSRHIYLLGTALVNLAIGLYLHLRPARWKRILQWIGSLLILVSPALLLIAFLQEPALGLTGRGWHSRFGMIGLFAGVMAHVVASFGAARIDTTRERP